MMKKMKRLLSGMLTLAMVFSFLPTFVLAEEDGDIAIAGDGATISISAKLGDNGESSSSITATDTTVIYATVSLSGLTAAAVNTVTIDIPVGLSLVSAPGIESISSAGVVTTTAYTTDQENYFGGTVEYRGPTWAQDAAISLDTGTVTSYSGTLSYPVSSSLSGGLSFTIALQVNPVFVAFGDEITENTLLGTVIATMNNDTTGAELPVYVTTQAYDLKISALSSIEQLPTAINSAVSSTTAANNITYGQSDTITLTTGFSLGYALLNCTHTRRAINIAFEVTLPTGAVLTALDGYTLGTSTVVDESAGTTTYTVTSTGGYSLTGASASFGSFATVQFPKESFTANDTQTVTIDKVTFDLYYYDTDSNTFVTKEISNDSTSDTGRSIDITIHDEPTAEEYNPTYLSYSSNSTQTVNENLDAQQLYAARRYGSGTSTTNMYTWDPIKIEFHAVATGTDGSYLDNVSSVVMSVPFLGDGTYVQYSSQLTKLTVQYENDENASVIYNETLSFDMTQALTSYKDYEVYKDDNISVVYTYTPYPMLTFTFAEGSNPIYIAAEFTGDNATLLTTATNNFVYGRPKEETSTEDTPCSSYYFATYETIEGVLTKITQSPAAGFKWKAVEDFALTLTDTSTTENYMYNAAEQNTFIMGVNYSSRLYGYHNLGSATVSNNTGSASNEGDDVVIKITANQESNDVVKEIYFPLSDDGDTSQITKLEYKFVGEDAVTYTDVTECPYFIASTEGDTAYTVKTSTAPYTFGVVQAPDGEELEYVEVTLEGWSDKTTVGYAMLRGYLEDATKLDDTTYTDDKTHTIAVSWGEGNENSTSVSVNSILKAPTTTNMSMSLLDAVANTEVTTGTLLSAHTLTPGLSTVIEFDIMGGVNSATYTTSYDGSWREITFNVVLPSDVTLTDVYAYDWRYEWNGTEYTPEIASTESLGEIEFTKVATVDNDDYFTNLLAGEIETVDIYTCTVVDTEANLYAIRHTDSKGTANGSAVSTIALTITPDTTATGFALPWSDILMLGSNASYGSFSTTSLSTAVTSTLVDNLTGVFQVGDEGNKIAVDNKSNYLFLSSPTVAMIHDAYVTYDGTEYVYNAHDDDSVPVFSSGETGSFHFTITDLTNIDTDATTTLTDYAVIPLPVATDTQLAGVQEFNVTLTGDIGCDYTTGTVAYKFAKISNTSALSNMTDVAALFSSGVNYSENMDVNVIIVKFSDMDYGDSIDVTVPFQVPSAVTNTVQYITLQAMCLFNSNDSGTVLSYYSGANPDENSANYANSYVSFAYYYPEWDISYESVLVDNDGTRTNVGDATFADSTGLTTTVNNGETLSVPTASPDAIAGYTFTGWYSDDRVRTTYADTAIYEETTLYARYNEKSYSVTYDYGYLTSGADDTFATVSGIYWTGNIVLPDNTPTRVGYDFAGWYTAKSEGTKVDANTSYQSLNSTDNIDVVLYAQWTAQEYTLTLDYNGGKDATGYHSTSTHKYLWTDEISIPTESVDTPTRAGYTFAGWKDEAGDTITTGDVYSTINSTTASDQTLYAQWTENSYTINFSYAKEITSEGGTEYSATAKDTSTQSITVTWTQALSGLPLVEALDSAYKFTSWQFTKDATTTNLPAAAVNGTSLTFAEVFEPLLGGDTASQEITIQAHYAVTIAIVDYYIPFDANGNFVTETADWTKGETFNVGSIDILTIAATGTHASFDGYTFMGWYTVQACTDGNTVAEVAGVNDITPVNIFGTINESTRYNIYAKYLENEYTITFDPNYTGAPTATTDKYSWTEEMDFPDVTRTGYTFDAWYGTATGDDKVTEGSTYKDSFGTDFDGTLGVTDGEGTTYDANEGYGTLYAQWTANSYTITYDVGDSSTAIYDTDVTYDDTITLASTIPTLTGYSFEGWYTDLSDSTTKVESGDTYATAGNTTLYANYTAKTFDVVYDYNDGVTSNGTLSNVDWDDVITLGDASRTGYDFDGWYVTGKDTKITSGTTLYSDVATNDTTAITLTAKWTAKEFDITCDDADSDDSTTTATIEDTAWDEAIVIDDASRTGYSFDGWYVDTDDETTKVTSGTTVYSTLAGDNDITAITLTAKWSLVSYTLSYDLVYTDDVTATPASEQVNWETDLTLPTVTQSGYTFSGWYLEDSYVTKVASGIYGTEIAVDADTTLYAKWTKNSVSSGGGGSVSTVVEEDTTATLDSENHFAYMIGYEDGTFAPDKSITRAETIVMFSRLLTTQMDAEESYTSTFSDVTEDLWYANAVGYMEQFGIVSGYEDGTFRGNEPITRAEFATIASRFDELISTDVNPFSDVDSQHWAYDYILSASAKGWITGYEEGTFLPDKSITRGEAVTLVNRVLERVCDEDFVTENSTEIRTFSDVAGHWAYYYILEAANGHDYTKDEDGKETWISLD